MEESLYDAIRRLSAEVSDNLDATDFSLPAHIQPLDTELRALSNRLGGAFEGPLSQFNDGLISPTELLDKLAWEAGRPV